MASKKISEAARELIWLTYMGRQSGLYNPDHVTSVSTLAKMFSVSEDYIRSTISDVSKRKIDQAVAAAVKKDV